MLSHFLRAVIIQGRLFNVLREYGAGETPQALKAPRRLPGARPRTARAWSGYQQTSLTQPKEQMG